MWGIEFQFPTGWNSTFKKLALGFEPYEFQFPTGWNSTLSLQSFSGTPRRFNSQRDGILLIFLLIIISIFFFVSIPNGMEFYIYRRLSDEMSKMRFNSQRDGILHLQRRILCPTELFQFPTGWNSTFCRMDITRPSGYLIPAATNLFKFYSEMRILPIPAAKSVWRKSVLISTR